MIQSLGIQAAFDSAINPILGCHYFLPGQGQCPSCRALPPFGQYQIILLSDRSMRVNNLARVITRKWNGWKSNWWLIDYKSDAVTNHYSTIQHLTYVGGVAQW